MIKNILIVRTDRIGDVILTLPLAGILKKHFPDVRVTFLVREYTRELVCNNKDIDEVIILKERNGKILFRENIMQIRQRRFDWCIVVFPLFIIALIIFLSGIKNRAGTGYRLYSFLFNHKTYEHRKYAERHELEYNVNLLKILGVDENINPSNVHFGLSPEKQNERVIDRVMSENGMDISAPFIIIHPGSGGSAIDLPLESFKTLTGMLTKNLALKVIVTGSVSEKRLCDELISDENVLNLAGKLSLGELIALTDRSAMLIANSTGPIHIAAALGRYVVGFYPKITACLPERWGPYTTKRLIYMPELLCNNCKKKQCRERNCMTTIDVTGVFENIKCVLEKERTAENK
ncbi:MAG: glycosyltransferase family 9 protein [Ignavibacteria bacterium]